MLESILALGFGLLLVAIAIIFVPTVIAFMRDHAYKWIILVLCVATFITGITWIVALVWAVWPSNKSLADPVLGNVTGTGQRNSGDTIGSVQHGIERGREQEKAVSVAVAVTPVPAVIAAVAQSPSVNSDTRECPHCAEIIKAAAKLCRFCKSEVEPLVSTKTENVESNWVNLVEPTNTPEPVAVVEPVKSVPVVAEPVKAVEPEVKPIIAERSPAVKAQRTESEVLRVRNLWALGFATVTVILGLAVVNRDKISTASLTFTPVAQTNVQTPAAKIVSLTLANGNLYKGEVHNDLPHGRGVLTAADGNREWKGTFVYGRITGKTEFTNRSTGSTYTGDFVNDAPFGQGSETFKDGAKFVGSFENGKRNGFGTYTYADGTTWSGIYKDGKPVK